MNPVLKRTLAGISVGALVIGLFVYAPLQAVLPILLVLSSLVQLEFYQMAKAYEPVTWFGLLAGGLWLSAIGFFGFDIGLVYLVIAFPAVLTAAFFLLCLFVLFRSRYGRPVATLASTLLGFLYVPFLLGFFLLTAQLGGGDFLDGEWSRTGFFTLFALIAVSKFSDTGGFAFGMAFGRHKMCPSISPKKSWEGLCGSMLFSAAVACGFYALSGRFGWAEDVPLWGMLSYPIAAGAGAGIALVATACDLIESRIKRECGVKDSATFMPAGMGGFLDMFDSILFIPALVYPILRVTAS